MREVEVTVLAGDPLVDGVGDEMGDAPPSDRIGGVGETHQLLFGEHVPQPKFDPETPVLEQAGASLHQGLGVDDAPVCEPRQGAERGLRLQECPRIDGVE